MDYFLKNDEPSFQNVVNGISLGLASTIVLVLVLISIFHFDLTDRVTFRIQGLIAIVDIVRHLRSYLIQSQNNELCVFSGFLGFFGDTLYVLLNVAIAMNVHLIGIRNFLPTRRLQIYLITGAVCVTSLINFIAYGFNVFGTNHVGVCHIRKNLPHRWVAVLFLVYLPNIPGVLYCAYVSFCLIKKFGFKKDYDHTKILSVIETPAMSYIEAISFIKKLYIRISLLPLFCVLSFSFYIIACLRTDFVQKEKDILIFLSRLGLRSAGTLNFVAFLFDPYFQMALRRFALGSRNKDSFSYNVESNVNHNFRFDKPIDFNTEEISTLNLPEEDLRLLGQAKYIKLM